MRVACVTPCGCALVRPLSQLSEIDYQEHSIVTERVTLITGASAGIGTERARVFAANGHRVAEQQAASSGNASKATAGAT